MYDSNNEIHLGLLFRFFGKVVCVAVKLYFLGEIAVLLDEFKGFLGNFWILMVLQFFKGV